MRLFFAFSVCVTASTVIAKESAGSEYTAVCADYRRHGDNCEKWKEGSQEGMEETSVAKTKSSGVGQHFTGSLDVTNNPSLKSVTFRLVKPDEKNKGGEGLQIADNPKLKTIKIGINQPFSKVNINNNHDLEEMEIPVPFVSGIEKALGHVVEQNPQLTNVALDFSSLVLGIEADTGMYVLENPMDPEEPLLLPDVLEAFKVNGNMKNILSITGPTATKEKSPEQQ